MKRLDPDSSIPLYAQLAEAIRYEIATGKLEHGEMLPALRAGAERWGVNLHTVRRAYASLAEKGIVRTDPQVGTFVEGGAVAEERVDPIDWFVSRTITEAYERHGLTVDELKLRVDQWGRGMGSGKPTVTVVDREEGEANSLATQLQARWAIAADGWSMQRPGNLPSGTLIAPLQQYNEIRIRWPERVGDIHFLGTLPDASLVSRIAGTPRPVVRAVLCERDLPAANGVVADLKRILPPGRVEVVPHVVSRAGELLTFVPDSIDAVLFPPRMWENLSASERSHAKAWEVRYIFEEKKLDRLADELGWRARGD